MMYTRDMHVAGLAPDSIAAQACDRRDERWAGLRRGRSATIFICLAILCAVGGTLYAAQSDPKDSTARSLQRSVSNTEGAFTLFNVNNVSFWHTIIGEGAVSPGGPFQSYYPRRTVAVIYKDGLVLGALPYTNVGLQSSAPGQVPVRIGGSIYASGMQPGWIEGIGSAARSVDANLKSVRMYRIRRDWLSMTEEELRSDAAEWHEIKISEVTSSHIAALMDQYERDWEEWVHVVPFGAPYIDRNGNGAFDPPPAFNYDASFGSVFTAESLIAGAYDEPGVSGGDPDIAADQVIWTAWNDLNPVKTEAMYGTSPMGLEVQLTLWGYNQSGPIGNIFFKRYRIINKGGVDTSGNGDIGSFWLDSMYVAQWSDPDLGSYSDDLVGCDTSLNLGYAYNGEPTDALFDEVSLPPPAIGYDFLAGPAYRTGQTADSAMKDLRYVHGWLNRPLTAFSYYASGSRYSDPPRDEQGAEILYKMLQGYAPVKDQHVFYDFPPGAQQSAFPLAGDPLKDAGSQNHIDGLGTQYSFLGGDRRFLLCSGPFFMAPGDTQEVYIGVVAAIGADRMSSVALMKQYDRVVQEVFDNSFRAAVPRSVPIRYANLDRMVALDWGWDAETIRRIEHDTLSPGGYVFEGYILRQLASSSQDLRDAVVLETFDVVNGYDVLLDDIYDPRLDVIIETPVFQGKNNGIEHSYVFQEDKVRDWASLSNSHDYYLAISSIYRSTIAGYPNRVLESPPTRLTVRPQLPPPGMIIRSAPGDEITGIMRQGQPDAQHRVRVRVTDPSRLKEARYVLRFEGSPPDQTATLVNHDLQTELVKVLIPASGAWTGDPAEFPTVDGMQIEIRYNHDPQFSTSLTGRLDDSLTRWEGGARWFEGNGFFNDLYSALNGLVVTGGPIGVTHGIGGYGSVFDNDSLYPVEIRFSSVDPNAQGQLALRIQRNYGAGTAAPSSPPYLYVDKSLENGYFWGRGWMGDFSKDTLPYVWIPFSVYDVRDSMNPRQLTVAFRDMSQNGKYDIPDQAWIDAVGAPGRTECLYIYDFTYDPTFAVFGAWGDNGHTLNYATTGSLASIPYIFWPRMSQGATAYSDTGIVHIIPERIFNPGIPADTFSWSITRQMAASYGEPETALEQVKNIRVFPNPYYAYNAAEPNRFDRFVTFSRLPEVATVRIFNLAGQLVRTLEKDPILSPGQFLKWDLRNHFGYPVASGLYIVHIDMPELGAVHSLKLIIVQEQEILNVK